MVSFGDANTTPIVRSWLGYTVECPSALDAAISVARMRPFGPPLTVTLSFDVGRDMTAAPLVNQRYLSDVIYCQ